MSGVKPFLFSLLLLGAGIAGAVEPGATEYDLKILGLMDKLTDKVAAIQKEVNAISDLCPSGWKETDYHLVAWPSQKVIWVEMCPDNGLLRIKQ